MGIFGDMRKLSRQSAEMREALPVQDQLSALGQVLAQGEQALTSMAAGGAGSAALMAEGVDAVATVTASRQTGMLVNHNPVIEFDLLIMHGGVPIPASCRQVVQQLHLSRAQVGCRLPVKIDPANPGAVWIDWSAPPPA